MLESALVDLVLEVIVLKDSLEVVFRLRSEGLRTDLQSLARLRFGDLVNLREPRPRLLQRNCDVLEASLLSELPQESLEAHD